MLKKVSFLILIAFLIFVFQTLYDANIFKKVESTNHHCRSVGPIEGPEDLKVMGNQLLISSTSLEKTSPKGGLFILDRNFRLKEVSLDIPFKFYPHGIDVLTLEDNSHRVYVVNHRYRNRSTVEIFDYQNAKMSHVKTIESPHFYNLNDVVAWDTERFFVSQDHYFQNSYLKFLENFFRLGLGKVFYHNEGKTRALIDGFHYTNGLHLDKQQNHLFVASMIGKNIKSFDLVESEQQIKASFRKQYDLDSFPDNLGPSPEGPRHLLIGAHPRIFSLRQHSKNPMKSLAPSVIKQLNLDTGDIVSIFSDNGEIVSSASAAVHFNQKLVVGNIFQTHLSVCNVE